MTKFKVGDRVRLTDVVMEDSHEWLKVGDEGVVRVVGDYCPDVGVEWEHVVPYCGHSLDGLCSSTTGWYVDGMCLALVEGDEDESYSRLEKGLDKLAKAIDNGRLQVTTMKKIINVLEEI